MKVVILATEASGDYLGSELIKVLKRRDEIEIKGIGGELMIKQGINSWVSIKNFNAIGIYEVLIRIFKFIKIMNFIEKKIIKYKPHLIITIDSPSFSYRVVKKLQTLRNNTSFVHYVAPTVWAWKSYRAKLFSGIYDQMFTLFKFEPNFFLKYGLNTKFVGHQIFFKKVKKVKKKKIIVFLPGSRSIEIKNNMKKLRFIIEKAKSSFKNYKLFILTYNQHKNLFRNFNGLKDVKIETNLKIKEKLMREASLAVAASGSVTLELINFKTPTIVFYDTHWITKILLKLLVKVKFASMINIIYGKEIIPEFLFEKFNTNNLISKMNEFLTNEEKIREQLKHFSSFSNLMLDNQKNPSELIVKYLKI